MRFSVYPADRFGCGMFRLAWPAEFLQQAGSDVRITFPDQRWDIGAMVKGGQVVDAVAPETDVIVIQRATHSLLVDCIPFWQAQGKKVVVDVDDDLSCIHPSNPAFEGLRPRPGHAHSWNNLARACRMADVVTVSTPALAKRYRPDAVVLPNYLPESYYGLPREDNLSLMWPASLGSHPNDADALGNTLERVLRETGVGIRLLGGGASLEAFRKAFGLREDPTMVPFVDLEEWPALLASIGIGVVPLADTKFNEAKSWLKVLELSAAGVPWVASDRAEYRRFHKLSGVGRLAERPNDWRRELKRLISDDAFRKEQSEAGRAASEAFRLRDHNWRWLEAWSG